MTATTKIGLAIALLVIGITILATGRINTGFSESYGETRYVVGMAHILLGVVFFIWGIWGDVRERAY